MRIHLPVAVMAALCLVASSAQASGQGFGRCKDGFADGTRVRTESRGEMTIGEVLVSDRVWSYNELLGKPGWSKVLQRVDGGQHYQLLLDFSEPGSAVVTKVCWRIQRNR